MYLFLQVFVIILQYQQNTLKTYTFARIHSFIHSSLSIIIMQIRFQKPRDHLYVAQLMTLISSSAVQHRETERLMNSEWEGSERFGRELI